MDPRRDRPPGQTREQAEQIHREQGESIAAMFAQIKAAKAQTEEALMTLLMQGSAARDAAREADERRRAGLPPVAPKNQ